MISIHTNMIKILRPISTLLITLGVVASASAQNNLQKMLGRESSGFNALDYVLQKPLGNDVFPANKRGFLKNMFIGAGGGVSFLGDSYSGNIKPGGLGEIQIGGWFTPVHGLQIAGDYGRLSMYDGVSTPKYWGLHVDYLMNITSLLRGYNSSRWFELIGTVGAEFQHVERYSGGWGNSGGMGASLRACFNTHSGVYFYAEPRLSVMSRYEHHNFDLYRFNTNVSLNVGVGYKLHSIKRHESVDGVEFGHTGDDNVFFEAGGGIWAPTSADKFHINPIANIAVGKMFTSVSGLKLTLDYLRNKGENLPAGSRKYRYSGIGSLDYVLNLSNFVNGYDPDRMFQLSVNAGVAAGAAVSRDAHKSTKWSPGLSVGVMGLFKVSPNWGIFVHPQLYAFNRKYNETLHMANGPMVGVEAGIHYTLGDYKRLYKEESEEAFAEAKHWFVSVGGAPAFRLRGDESNKFGFNAFVSVGQRFSPLSTWRVSIFGDYFSKAPKINGYSLHADYLTSIKTAMYGYDPDRKFDVQTVFGVSIGTPEASLKGRLIPGIKGGLQFTYRLNNNLDLFVEPQLQIAQMPFNSNYKSAWTPVARGLVGLSYNW